MSTVVENQSSQQEQVPIDDTREFDQYNQDTTSYSVKQHIKYIEEMINDGINHLKEVKQNLKQVHASFDQLCDQVNDKLQQIEKDFNIKYENLQYEFSKGARFLKLETDEKSKDISGDREDVFIIETELNNLNQRIIVQERNLGFKEVDL